jgi:hypothetical protein
MRLTVYAMCGLAFSGKSTAARRIARELGADLVSLDAINHERGLRGGDGLPVEEWERTSHIAMSRVRRILGEGRCVVVDDTFSHRFLRDRCRAVAEGAGARFLVLHMDTPPSVIDARRAQNRLRPTRHDVRDEVFAAHRDGFQHPTADEPVIRLATDADVADWLARERKRG